jgi:Fe2+ transport system protein FeoA
MLTACKGNLIYIIKQRKINKAMVHEQHPLELSGAPEGSMVEVVGFLGRGRFRSHLSAMGIAVGAKLEVLKNSRKRFFGGPVLVSTEGSRFGLGKGMAHRILVKILED